MLKESDVVRIAKRENNNIRKYIVVNRLQGKHIPVSPKNAFAMFDELAELVGDIYRKEKLLLVGFAETATAIGARLAVQLNTEYIQTTRESIEGVDYLFFTESHSHATEQKLVQEDIDRVINHTDRIVFVEDEITTGDTVLKIIEIIRNRYQDKVKFSVASLLNGMNPESFSRFTRRGINIHYLIKTDHSSYTQKAELYNGRGLYERMKVYKETKEIEVSDLYGYIDARRCVQGKDYSQACERLWEQVKSCIDIKEDKNILVVGTEEFMYPGLYVAAQIEKMDKTVRFHATTRSPITVSEEKEYPLHHRFELASLYDSARTTYIYDLVKYDQVFIITDTKDTSDIGLGTLREALSSVGNDRVTVFRWCKL